MCGIAGILRFDGAPVAPEAIAALTDALAHRGRDSAAHRIGGIVGDRLSEMPGVALGHRRLSVIDLSVAAGQPMRSPGSAATIVYNGELYNYRALRDELVTLGYTFRTDSDTEVLLVAYDAWGEDCLDRLNGMFAFAIWDDARRCLFCARDPIGIKPFYYTLDPRGFAFASESQALARLHPQGLDRAAAACYLLSMYVPRHLSIYAGVEKLLPGEAMRVSADGTVSKRRFWRMPTASRREISRRDAVGEMRERLDRAVAAQLRSDVPVGALLSGGFDSGMIVASAARTGAPLHTYSVGFDDGRQTNELPVARAMAKRYGTIHHERVIAADEVMDFLDRAIGSLSEPVADSAIVPTYCLSGMAADDGVKVLLSGTGGDEVFGGYSRYVPSTLQRRVLLALPRGLRRFLGAGLLGDSVLGARFRHPALDMMVYTGGSPALARRLFGGETAFQGFLESLVSEIFPPAPTTGRVGLYEHMGFDLQVYLPDLLLTLLDQLTMAHTVEGRVPLLDVDLIAASYSLPPEFHASAGDAATRRLMREMAVGRVEPETFTARKMGFSGPVTSWIAGNRAAFREVILDAREMPILEELPLERLWEAGADQPTHAWAMEMFSVFCFAGWQRRHVA